jgi:DNA polymerase-3 subunit epsilon
MTLSFVALDFETANSARSSACSLGMTKVVDGEVTDTKYELFLPPEGHDYFEPRNISIHGITPAQVKSKPRFAQAWPEFSDFIGELPVVAHNASFDLSVLRGSLQASDISWPNLQYACTMVMSRKLFKLTSHSLLYVAHSAGVAWDSEMHHDALYDSKICAEIVLSMAKQKSSDSLFGLLESLQLRAGELNSDGWQACRSNVRVAHSYHSNGENRHSTKGIEVNQDANPDHPLFGKVVVFTGKLYSMPRPEAWQLVASVGGIPKDTMSKSTNLLVLGEQDPFKLRPGETTSSKFREAEKMRESGFEIEVINETDFLSYLEPEAGTA